MPEEVTGPRDQEKEFDSLLELLPGVLWGLVSSIILNMIGEMSDVGKLSIVLGIGLIIAALRTIRRSDRAPRRLSRRVMKVLAWGLIFIVVLVILGGFILGKNPLELVFVVGWMVLMVLAIRFSYASPSDSLFQTLLPQAAAISLGAGLVIGGAPVTEVLEGGPFELTIINNRPEVFVCYVPLINSEISIPPGEERTLVLPAVACTVQHEGDVIRIRGAYGMEHSIPVRPDTVIIFDGSPFDPGDSCVLSPTGQRAHTLIITSAGA